MDSHTGALRPRLDGERSIWKPADQESIMPLPPSGSLTPREFATRVMEGIVANNFPDERSMIELYGDKIVAAVADNEKYSELDNENRFGSDSPMVAQIIAAIAMHIAMSVTKSGLVLTLDSIDEWIDKNSESIIVFEQKLHRNSSLLPFIRQYMKILKQYVQK